MSECGGVTEDDVGEYDGFHYFVDVFSCLMCRQMSLSSEELSTFFSANVALFNIFCSISNSM